MFRAKEQREAYRACYGCQHLIAPGEAYTVREVIITKSGVNTVYRHYGRHCAPDYDVAVTVGIMPPHYYRLNWHREEAL